jgi:hypothetical protein
MISWLVRRRKKKDANFSSFVCRKFHPIFFATSQGACPMGVEVEMGGVGTQQSVGHQMSSSFLISCNQIIVSVVSNFLYTNGVSCSSPLSWNVFSCVVHGLPS